VILYEIIHDMHREKQNGVIFKINFEKTCDKIKWLFVRNVLEMKGFSCEWCQWIDSIIQGGYVGIKVNDHVDQNFQTKKGLWHKIQVSGVNGLTL
jgi:hypothetical protein